MTKFLAVKNQIFGGIMKKSVLLFFCCAMLNGCVATQPLRKIAVDSNRLVAETADKQTLLNILRAKDRMPMHFSSFTAIRGNLSLSTEATFSTAFPQGSLSEALDAAGNITGSTRGRGANSLSPSFEASVASNPNFDLAVFDSKEFQNGILSPVSPSLIEYYLRLGWKQDLLTALLVSQVEVKIGNDDPVSYPNDPDESENFGKFVEAVTLRPATRKGGSTPLIPLDSFGKDIELGDIDKLDGGNFDVELVKSKVHQDRAKRAYVVRKKAMSKSIRFDKLGDGVAKLMGGKDTFTINCSAPASGKESEDAVTCLGTRASDGKKISINIFLRSPEAVLYFIGSYVRCDLIARGIEKNEDMCSPYALGDGAKVIKVDTGSSRDSLITIKHRGKRYSLPEPKYPSGKPDHRGSQAVVLAQQLVNLQKSADSLPSSSSIRLLP